MIGGYSPLAKQFPMHGYQQKVAYWILDRIFVEGLMGAGALLDPGLGKSRLTLAVLDFLFQMGAIRKALIVAPLRPVYSVWPDEIKDWGFPQTWQILHGKTAANLKADAQIELMNFGSLHKIEDIENRWDILIIDEGGFVKNWSTERTKKLRKVAKSIPRCILLNGTPGANSLHELFSQMYFIDRGEALGKTVGGFRRNYCRPVGQQQWNKWLVRKEDQRRLKDAIKDKVVRLEAEDYLDMPDLIFNDVWFDLDAKTQTQYNKLKRELYAQLNTGEVTVASAAAAYGKCRQFANGHVYDEEKAVHVVHQKKVRALNEIFEELSGKPLLVFYHFKSDLAAIKKGVGVDKPFKNSPVIQGGMKIEEVNAILKAWNKGKYPSLLCQWQAAAHGLNMQGACNDVGCFGLIDSLDLFQQAYRRVYRQGVKGWQVRVHRFLCRGTVDVPMLERMNGRYSTNREFLGALKKHAKA